MGLGDRFDVGIFNRPKVFRTDDTDQLPEDLDPEELKQFKEDLEDHVDVDIGYVEAYAIQRLQTPMLESYISNVLGRIESVEDVGGEVSVRSVMDSKATREYARRVGAVEELEESIEILR